MYANWIWILKSIENSNFVWHPQLGGGILDADHFMELLAVDNNLPQVILALISLTGGTSWCFHVIHTIVYIGMGACVKVRK